MRRRLTGRIRLAGNWAFLLWTIRISLVIAAWVAGIGSPLVAAEPFSLKDGDRVVWVGNTFAERDQTYGYTETLLTSRYPDRGFTFRNLGWSGDTVYGIARARFGPPAEGFQHLLTNVEALQPTVILVSYGANESYAGESGLPAFQQQLESLLAALGKSQPRLVFLSPLKLETLPRPLPDPTAQNERLRLYANLLRQVAEQRQAPFVDLFTSLGESRSSPHLLPLTDNGVHLTAYGYSLAAEVISAGLGRPAAEWRVKVDSAAQRISAEGTTATELVVAADELKFRLADARLPAPLAPPPFVPAARKNAAGEGEGLPRILQIDGLAPGRYTLQIDEKAVTQATAAEWQAGVRLTAGPEFAQVEALRSAINAKNQLFFHRWRPQNETYLFGFRKHEQGNNAKEIPEFDPLVTAAEARIATLRAPAPHEYSLKPGP